MRFCRLRAPDTDVAGAVTVTEPPAVRARTELPPMPELIASDPAAVFRLIVAALIVRPFAADPAIMLVVKTWLNAHVLAVDCSGIVAPLVPVFWVAAVPSPEISATAGCAADTVPSNPMPVRNRCDTGEWLKRPPSVDGPGAGSPPPPPHVAPESMTTPEAFHSTQLPGVTEPDAETPLPGTCA